MPSFDRVLHVTGNRDKFTSEELKRFREFLNCSMIFNPDYTWGYTMALMDMVALFDDGYLKRLCEAHKLPKTMKTMRQFFRFVLYNREVLRDRARNFYIGYNADKKQFYLAAAKNISVLLVEDTD